MQNLEINGWKIYFHSCFFDQLRELALEVAHLAATKPNDYKGLKQTKLLAGIIQVIEDKLPADPLGQDKRHGGTLGDEYKHWFRVKFGAGRFRLFYRCSEQHKTIVIGWVNDFDTLRTYGSKTDAYKIFTKMLKAGNPPDDWRMLFKEAIEHTANTNIPGFFQE